MNGLQDKISDLGWLIAGAQTVKGDKTLRDVKPERYTPKNEFGKWLECVVAQRMKGTKAKFIRDDYENLTSMLGEKEALITEIRVEAEVLFTEYFGKERLLPDAITEKAFKEDRLAKLRVAAKSNGVDALAVDYLTNVVMRNVLNKHGLPAAITYTYKIKEAI